GAAGGARAAAAGGARAARRARAAARPPLLLLASATALVGWTGLIRLVSFETRGRDLPGRWLCLGLAALSSAFHGWPAMTASLAMSGTMAWRWKRELKTRARFTLGMIALALGLALGLRVGHVVKPGVLHGAVEAAHGFARAILITAAFYSLFGAVSLLRAWASDPSLGIRTVSRRLRLSHLFVGLVPVLLIVALWVATTVLGVLNERAIVGGRVVGFIGDNYRAQLAAALQHPSEVGVRLAALPGTIGSMGDVRVWRRAGDRLVRIAGPEVPGEERLAAWLDSLGTLPAHGVVNLGDTAFVGAVARGAGGEAVMLSPMGPTLASLPDSLARARLDVWKHALLRPRPSRRATGSVQAG